MNVALVVPDGLTAKSFMQPPIDMLMAAAYLLRSGHQVLFEDNRVSQLSTYKLAFKFRSADVIVITTTPYDHIQNYFVDYRLKTAFQTIKDLKKLLPSVTVIVCGAHATVRSDIVFAETNADVVIKWEYDYTISRLIDAMSCGHPSIDKIPNVCSRTNKQYDVLGQHFNTSLNKEEVGCIPAYDLINFDDYFGDIYIHNKLIKQGRAAIVLASRGCKFNCGFCFNFFGQTIRYRSHTDIINELLYLQKLRVKTVFFIDYNFAENPEWVAKCCKLIIEEGISIKWSAQMRCDSVSKDLLQLMAKANCTHLWFGVESFNTCMLRFMHKYNHSDIVKKAINTCQSVGIKPHQFIVIGLPGETRASLNETIRQVHALKVPYIATIATPRIGTKYFDLAIKEYPELGDSFYQLEEVRGIVGNELTKEDVCKAVKIFGNREFIYLDTPPII